VLGGGERASKNILAKAGRREYVRNRVGVQCTGRVSRISNVDDEMMRRRTSRCGITRQWPARRDLAIGC
jgi:hypothetical protein